MVHEHQNLRWIDPNRHLVGRHVRVIKKNRFKDYKGIIKSTSQRLRDRRNSSNNVP